MNITKIQVLTFFKAFQRKNFASPSASTVHAPSSWQSKIENQKSKMPWSRFGISKPNQMTSHCQFATCNLSPATMPVVTYVNVIGWRHCLVATESYASRGTNIYRSE